MDRGVYDKLIAKGFNLIVTNLFPVWNWTTHQVKPANGPADINLMLWHQRGNYRSEDRDETPDTRIYDTDRMNLFTWKRIEDHIGYLARRAVLEGAIAAADPSLTEGPAKRPDGERIEQCRSGQHRGECHQMADPGGPRRYPIQCKPPRDGQRQGGVDP